jgi:hypothetical protein
MELMRFSVFTPETTKKKYLSVDYNTKLVVLSNIRPNDEFYLGYSLTHREDSFEIIGHKSEISLLFSRTYEGYANFFDYSVKLKSHIKTTKRWFFGSEVNYIEEGMYFVDDECILAEPKQTIKLMGANFDLVIR